MEIVLCRHTQTPDNLNGVYSGQNDVELNKTGWQQAWGLTSDIGQLAGPPIGAVLSSDLIRAGCLADLIGEQARVEPIKDPALREVSIGKMTGMVRELAYEKFPDDRYKTTNPNFDYTDIGGESAEDVRWRHLNFLGYQIQRLRIGGIRRVVVVGHGTSFRSVFQHRLGLIPQLHDQGKFQLIAWE